MTFRPLFALSAFSLLVVFANAEIIGNSSYLFGIGPNGEAYTTDFGFYGTGLVRLADGYDDVARGLGRAGWGVTTSTGGTSYADELANGSGGISGASKTFGPNVMNALYIPESATYTANLDGGLTIKKSYSFAALNVMAIHTTITNVSGASLSALYREAFDKHPTYGELPWGDDECVSIDALGGDVVEAGRDALESPVPGSTMWLPGTGDFGPASYFGGAFDVDLGTLADGASKQFIIYYGVNNGSQSELDLRNQVYGLGATFQISNSSHLHLNNNSTVGYQAVPNAVPEPASMIALGLGALATIRRRRKA
ncbi:MAG: PEP-CTERM sorting domain-containing protein [Fimbriimonas sp.]